MLIIFVERGFGKMFEVFVKTHFSAAHRLVNYQGDCAHLHGHNWDVLVTLGTADLDELGLAVDFRELKQALNRLLGELDHTELNQHPELGVVNPTCEIVARFLYRRLAAHFTGAHKARVLRVQVSETPGVGVIYYE